MKVIKLRADGQNLRLASDNDPIIAGTKGGYLKVSVDLSEEWAGCTIAMRFWSLDGDEIAVKYIPGSNVPVPDSLTDDRLFRISLMGAKGGMRITTNRVTIRQRVIK